MDLSKFVEINNIGKTDYDVRSNFEKQSATIKQNYIIDEYSS